MKRNHGSTSRAGLLSLLLAVVPAGPGLALEQYENDRVPFDEPVFAMAAWFFDVEADFALTGSATGIRAAMPVVAFSGPQGQSAQSFPGFVSDTPLDATDIFFATGEDIDETVLDGLRYVVVPEPTTVVLMGLGLLGLGLGGRRPART